LERKKKKTEKRGHLERRHGKGDPALVYVSEKERTRQFEPGSTHKKNKIHKTHRKKIGTERNFRQTQREGRKGAKNLDSFGPPAFKGG